MEEEFNSLEEVNAAIEQLENLIRETVDLHYDNITIKDLVDFDITQDLITAKFVGGDNKTYALEIDPEGEPTLHERPLSPPLTDDFENAQDS